MFQEISRTVSSALSLKELLRVLAQRTAAYCGTEGCSIFLWDPAGEQVVTMMSQTASGEELDLRWHQFNHPGRLTLDQFPLLAATKEQRRPIVLNNPATSSLVQIGRASCRERV